MIEEQEGKKMRKREVGIIQEIKMKGRKREQKSSRNR